MNPEQVPFLQLLVHELRNALGPIRSAVAVARLRAPDNDFLAQPLDVIDGQVDAAARLLNKVRDLLLLDAGVPLTLDCARVPLQDMVRAAIAAAQPGIRAKTQTLRAQLARDPIVMHADAERLRMAFAEVLVNASRFSGDGDVLTLEVAVEDSTAVIVVSDNGAGIAPELLPVIFEGARDAQRGLGIGLRLARAWIKAHGGSIALASSGVGRGTRVEVRLPVAPREVAPATDAARSAASPEKEERVLVADDSAPLRETLAALLESAGYAVRTVPDGYQALQLAALWQPDYVFLDLHMSPLSGFEAAQALRGARTRGVMKLILLSGSDLSADLIEGARRAGFDAWIDKAAIAEQWQGVLHRLRK